MTMIMIDPSKFSPSIAVDSTVIVPSVDKNCHGAGARKCQEHAAKLDHGKAPLDLLTPSAAVFFMRMLEPVPCGIADLDRALWFLDVGDPRTTVWLMMHLQPDKWMCLEHVSCVLAYGVNKYGRNNWLQGLQWSRVLASIRRHYRSYDCGVLNDMESGLPHAWHILTNLFMLLEYQVRELGENDLC